MKRDYAAVLTILWVILFTPSSSLGSSEIEPNNFDHEATVVKDHYISGVINDEKDICKVALAETGPVSLILEGIPADLQVMLGVSGFPHVGWVDGSGDLNYTFDAEKHDGLIWVQFQWAGSVCGYDWCAVRFSPDGHYYGVKPSATMPEHHNGIPIISELPAYKLLINSKSSSSLPHENIAPPSQIIWEDEDPGDSETLKTGNESLGG
jgi:hypothetical protein